MTEKNYIKSYIEEPIKKHWNQKALANYKGESFTYGEVAKKIARFHIMFEECGVQKGDKIAVIGKNSARWGIIYLSAISYGAVIVPILADFHPKDIHHIVNHSDSVALFVDDSIWNNVDENEMPKVKAIISLKDYSILIQRRKAQVREVFDKLDVLFEKKYGKEFGYDAVKYPEISNKELGVISYTSGTTGFSKGVMLPLNSLSVNVKFAWENLEIKSGNQIVSFLPLAHSFGCAFDFLWPFSKGAYIHFLQRIPTPEVILKAFADIRPEVIFSVPLIMEKIYKKQILPMVSKPSIKLMLKIPVLNQLVYKKIREKLEQAFGNNFQQIVLGGAPLSKEVGEFFDKIKFRYTVGYGMTECGPLIGYEHWSTTKPGSAGKVITPLIAKIESDDPENKVGEIKVKGENVMYGYYKNEEATKEVLSEDGWLSTGDLGVIRDDFIYIRGRNKSMILGSSGENIYPEEIEAIINNMSYVGESVVVANEKNKLVALVYPDYEAIDAEGYSDSDIKRIISDLKPKINEHLPAYKKIVQVRLYPNEFEKTPKKSIKRFMYELK